jgi:hypothetical protein
VGPWCFLDRFGPLSFGEAKPMDVAPPHIGLQTFGEVKAYRGRLLDASPLQQFAPLQIDFATIVMRRKKNTIGANNAVRRIRIGQ